LPRVALGTPIPAESFTNTNAEDDAIPEEITGLVLVEISVG
jgi:hypothetical protein